MFVAALARGAPPWVRPWSQVVDTIPVNAQTRRQYRGVNFALLSLEAERCDYRVNRWMNRLSIKQPGDRVKRLTPSANAPR